jgi:ferredoxin-NADP reductase
MNTYQGLFYLLAGFSSFIILTLGLRVIAMRSKGTRGALTIKNKWFAKEKLIIVDIIEDSHDVKTFRFKRENGEDFSLFAPGQFLSFQIGEDEKCLRSYSISGSCENTSTLQVSIKMIKDGIGSGWFHNLKLGDIVLAFPPGGHFSDDKLDSEVTRVYVGGGIGITPLISMIKTGIDRSSGSKMILFYGMASVKDLVFHEELLYLSRTYDYFDYYPTLSPGAENWDGDLGFINYEFIVSKIDLNKNEHFYFCGPPVMTDGIMSSLTESGFIDEQLHSEKFASPTAFDLTKIEAVDVKIDVNGEELQYNGKDTILEFFEDQDIPIAFACRSGVCGECKCKLIEGDVDSITDSGLTNTEKKENYILTCVSRPRTNIKLEV